VECGVGEHFDLSRSEVTQGSCNRINEEGFGRH